VWLINESSGLFEEAPLTVVSGVNGVHVTKNSPSA